jgi:hypothetical protein
VKQSYVILGYGSLIWDLDDLAPHVELPWHMHQGPALPMEFSRISPKRKMGLVVVLDPEHGELCDTHAVRSIKQDIHVAADDLKRRERATDISFIGAVCLRTGFARSHHSDILERVAGWCEQNQVHGAVWTDLPRNFTTHTNAPFTPEAGKTYLQSLTGESLREAVRYIDNAPPATITPLRRMLSADPWWQALPREL